MSIGYERIVESYEQELSGGEKTREDAAGLLKSSEVLRHRYGRINLQVGEIPHALGRAGPLGSSSPRRLLPRDDARS